MLYFEMVFLLLYVWFWSICFFFRILFQHSKKYRHAAKAQNLPHIFAVADQSYQSMMHNHHDQVLIVILFSSCILFFYLALRSLCPSRLALRGCWVTSLPQALHSHFACFAGTCVKQCEWVIKSLSHASLFYSCQEFWIHIIMNFEITFVMNDSFCKTNR